MIVSTTKIYSNQQVLLLEASLKVFSFFLSITCVSNFTFNPLHLAVAVGRYGANFYCSRCDIVYRGSMMIMGGTAWCEEVCGWLCHFSHPLLQSLPDTDWFPIVLPQPPIPCTLLPIHLSHIRIFFVACANFKMR